MGGHLYTRIQIIISSGDGLVCLFKHRHISRRHKYPRAKIECANEAADGSRGGVLEGGCDAVIPNAYKY